VANLQSIQKRVISVEKGKLVEFRLQGERRLAVADRPDGKKDWIVVDQGGQSHKLRPQRVEYEVLGGPYQSTEIKGFLQEVQNYLEPEHLEVAWEILVEDGATVTPQGMAQLLFSEQSPVFCYAAHCLLAEDKIYFKNKGDSYEPRSISQVEEIKHQQSVELQRQQEKAGFLTRLQQAIAGESVEWIDSDRPRLESLERLVLQPELSHRQAEEVLQLLDRHHTPEAAFSLLVELGWWQRHENLFLRRSSYPRQFSKKVLDLAYSVLHSLPPDPSRFVFPNDELDLEARKRSTSLYLPTGMISMFPTELAIGPMSLVQGKFCPALSFGVILGETGEILDYSIHASLIKPTYRLTYEDVDEMLQMRIQAEPEIEILATAAKLRKDWRKSQGAINIKMPEAVIKVKSEDEIIIQLLEASFSRQLVAEMMILAGEVAGRYCQEHNLPVPFRGQPQPELPSEEELLSLPPGPVRACAVRRCMPRSEISITPYRHASLGLDTYTQVTSPIRRYTDLLTHFQLKAHLRGEALPFAGDQVQQILYSVTLSSQEATSVERQTNRYWSLEYLRRNADQVWQGLMLRWLREDENLGLILLEELGLELPHRFERPVSPGDRLAVQVSRADPHRDEIRFRELLANES
jgi:exoribonuclease-2